MAMDDVPPPAPAPISRPLALGANERFETFELTPLTRSAAETAPMPIRPAAPLASRDTDATITALLARLERSVAARDPQETPSAPAPRSLD
ncbi:hypothetical protein ABTL29_19305, partial [Acinetobacter baumannii]